MSIRDAIGIVIIILAVAIFGHFVQNKIKNDSSIAVDTGRIADAIEKIALAGSRCGK